MPYAYSKPEPPAKTENVSVFGMHNGVWRLTFLLTYFGMCTLTIRSCLGCEAWQLAMLHTWWASCAAFLAQAMNELVCELVDEDKQRAYARELVEALARAPKSNRLELDAGTGQYEQVPLAPHERPMIDKDMGVRIRT
jgi:hypothetical protein